MSLSVLSTALIILVASVIAQDSANFIATNWQSVTVGQTWPIHWTVGNGQPVSLVLGNSTWSTPIFSNQSASPGSYDWTVAVPAGFSAGNYTLGLSQAGAGTNYSPLFLVSYRAEPVPTSATISASANATMTTGAMVGPTVTVVWWDDECGCHKTTTSSSLAATGTGAVATTYTWWDGACGCTKTALAPAPTMAPGCPGAGCSNYTAPGPTSISPPMSTASSTVTSSHPSYTGAATRVSISALGVIAMIVATLVA